MGEKLKILFISPEFYQYTNAIISELEKHDIETVFYPWWPHLNLLSKYFFKKKENVRRKKMDKYLDKIIKVPTGSSRTNSSAPPASPRTSSG